MDHQAPSEELKEDWSTLAEKYSKNKIQISGSPEKELSSTALGKIRKAYESSRGAGKQRARELMKDILERRKENISKSIDSLEKDFHDAELRYADERKKPLSEEAKRKARRLGTNIYLLREYLCVSFDDLAAAGGISQSSLYKITRKGRIPTITTLYQLSIGFGLPPWILVADLETLQTLDRVADTGVAEGAGDRVAGSTELEDTASEMNDMLHGDPDVGKDPGFWLDDIEEAVIRVWKLSSGQYRSNAGILGAIIGRHHGGEYGGFLAATVAHRMRRGMMYSDLGGFKFPSSFIWRRIETKLAQVGIDV